MVSVYHGGEGMMERVSHNNKQEVESSTPPSARLSFSLTPFQLQVRGVALTHFGQFTQRVSPSRGRPSPSPPFSSYLLFLFTESSWTHCENKQIKKKSAWKKKAMLDRIRGNSRHCLWAWRDGLVTHIPSAQERRPEFRFLASTQKMEVVQHIW